MWQPRSAAFGGTSQLLLVGLRQAAAKGLSFEAQRHRELCGEHYDYLESESLPCAIETTHRLSSPIAKFQDVLRLPLHWGWVIFPQESAWVSNTFSQRKDGFSYSFFWTGFSFFPEPRPGLSSGWNDAT